MKKLFTLALLSYCSFTFAQEWTKLIHSDKPTFFDLQRAFNEYYNNVGVPGWEADNDYQIFKRWEYFMEPRVSSDGSFNPNANWEALQQINGQVNYKGQKVAATAGSSWTATGPQNAANGYAGVGRVNSVTFDPNNSNNVWIGTASGGIWKSTNQGLNWTDMSNNMPNLSIADVAIDPNNSNTLYVATGDGFGYIGFSNIFWGGTYSTGVMKSTNGGLTWTQTPLSYTVNQRHMVNRLIINPVNPNVLIAVGTDGINRTTNGGTSWTKVRGGRFFDIEFNPHNPNTVYACKDSIFKSMDGGVTWQHLSGSPVLSTSRVSIETTAADSNYVYVMDITKKLYRSTNAGSSWTQMSASIPSLTLYGYYDCILSVCPVDKDLLYAAGMNMVKSTNGGSSFVSVATTGIHVDHHAVEFIPGSTTVFGGNDGGIYRSTNGGVNWTDYTSGLQITQFYRLGISHNNPTFFFAGAQDNGTLRHNSGVWSGVSGGDGMECLVDHTNPNIVYVSYQNGTFRKSTNGGNSFTNLSTGGGHWVSPMVMHPTNNSILFFGGSEVKKSVNGGSSWVTISSFGSPNLVSLAVGKSDPNYIYAATHKSIYVTSNGGTTWTNTSTGLPLANNAITYIAISNTDPNTAWISLSGYQAGEKVYKTTDAGSTWTNISGNLPNIPANCIINDENSTSEAIYVGTDLGVYYLDNTQSGNWTSFNIGLPNVIISELEINYFSQKIYAATYGRGIWESPLQNQVFITNTKKQKNTASTISLYPNPNKGLFNIDVNTTESATQVNIIVYNTIGEIIYKQKDQSVFTKQYTVDLSSFANGIYYVKTDTSFDVRMDKVVLSR